MKYTKPVVASANITPRDASCGGPNMFACSVHTCKGTWVCTTYWNASNCKKYSIIA